MMGDERLDRVQDLFLAALELQESDREAWMGYQWVNDS